MGQDKNEKIKMLAKDAENATSNEFFLKDIKNKKNLHKSNGNNDCVSGYQAVRSVLTTASTTCVEWRPLRVEFVFTWRTCLLSHTSQHGVRSMSSEKSHLGEEVRWNLWPILHCLRHHTLFYCTHEDPDHSPGSHDLDWDHSTG